MNHKTVHVRVGNHEAAIDEKIAPLIREIWTAGIETVNSCEDNKPGIVWVQFASSEGCAVFLDIISRYTDCDESEFLYRRVLQRESRNWEYALHPNDYSLDEWLDDDDVVNESHSGVSNFGFSVSVRFPVTDLPILVERLSRFNLAVAEYIRLHGAADNAVSAAQMCLRVLHDLTVGQDPVHLASTLES